MPTTPTYEDGDFERYPRFFELLEQLDQACQQLGEENVHGNPDFADLFAELVTCAPPSFKDAAHAALAPLLPTPTHVDDQGRPLFSAQQIAEKFGVSVQEVERLVDEQFGGKTYTGPVNPIM